MLFSQGGILNKRGIIGVSKPFSPTDIANLGLWVSADVGVTIENINFLSYIELTGAGTSSSDGFYYRPSGGTTSFIEPDNGNEIYWDSGEGAWLLYDATLEDITYANFAHIPEEDAWYIYSAGVADEPTASYDYTSENDVITSVLDRSPSGNNLSKSSGSPKISSTQINGKAAFDFTGGARLSGTDIVTAKTIYAVIRPSQTPAAYSCIVECTGGGLYTAISGSYWGAYWSTETISNNTVNANTNAIIGIIRGSGTATTFRRDGAIVRNGNYGAGSYTRSTLYVGNDGTGGQTAKAIVSEIIIYTDAITSTQAGQIESYLNAKYAIY